ncbi:hypothetical protein M758_2G243000 [Ceratodon purpureus]|nr:hypothetical protein M758_2G243000 [Ceratodon purpureus]
MDLKLLVLGFLIVAAYWSAEGDADPQAKSSRLLRKRDSARRKRKSDNSFDYFLMWPASYCDTKKGCCFPVTGEPGPFFGIHGLWPNRNDGTYPSSCGNEAFDPSELAGVVDHLNTKWGTLACKSRYNEDFWEHEWSKHGTCSGLTQHQYFQASLDLYNNFDITGALRNAGIVPDDRFYSIANITSALTELLGFAPQIECNKDPEGNRQLHQVYICVAKDASTIIECPASIRNPCQGSVQFPVYGSAPSRHAVSTVEVHASSVVMTESIDSEL